MTGSPFELIVTDMSIDPTESAALMCRAARTLELGGQEVTEHLIRRGATADGWQRHLVKRPG